MYSLLKKYKEAIFSAILLIAALTAEFWIGSHSIIYLSLYSLSYLLVGGPVWIKAVESIKKGTIFSEFLLMGIATVGAFAIGEYAEGVAVMLFYMIGEYAQHGAVHRAHDSIKALIDQQPEQATVEQNGRFEEFHPSKVEVGSVVLVKPGEKVPLDGQLLSDAASLNTAALTGESKPVSMKQGEQVWAGSINGDTPIRVKVTAGYKDTKLSRILQLVQEASLRKAPTQRFMTKFAKIYTPAVVWGAVALTFLPWLFVDNYLFQEWLYRALIFLVVSCPCGLVISIPLGYFGGIGAASRNGILFKGSDYLDRMRKLDALYFDKTGTLTEGVFEVQSVQTFNGIEQPEILRLAASLEQQSTHPIGKAILQKSEGMILSEAVDQQEMAGHGLTGIVDDQKVSVGNERLMQQVGISLPDLDQTPYTRIHVAVGSDYAGNITISDRLKEDSKQAINRLRKNHLLHELVVLSGDKQQVVDKISTELGLTEAYGEMLPEDKYDHLEQALSPGKTIGYVGDGINDAPVIKLADVGIAMGGIGSDVAIETADVVIQTNQPSKLSVGMDIAKFTHRVVWQNIAMALGIKLLVMGLAAIGMATMWEAIFADVGVALLAIANAIRIQRTSYS